MNAALHITSALIRRRYDQGLDSIVRLVNDLQDQIADLTGLAVTEPQKVIQIQTTEIIRLQKTIDNKNIELLQAHQLNQQLQHRLHQLEKFLETDTSPTLPLSTPLKRDSHNSNQPPSLDLPWQKPKRTRNLQRKSGLKSGGQFGHPGVTLKAVSSPNRIILHPLNNCLQCGT